MQDFCFHASSEASIIAALESLGLTTPDMDGRPHPVGIYCYDGQIVDRPGQYRINPDGTTTTVTASTYLPGVYAKYRATDEQAGTILAATLLDGVELVDPPAGLPLYGGTWMGGPDVAALQKVAIARIDAHAELLCNQVITPGSAQMARYQRKEGQARAYLEAQEAGTLPEGETARAEAYPAVYGEVGITAETAEGVARVIVAMADAWWAYGDAVEAARLAGKRAVEAAGTPAAVAAAEAAIVWPAVPE